MPKKKRCGSCKTMRPRTEFGQDRTRPCGLQRRCKECVDANNARVNPRRFGGNGLLLSRRTREPLADIDAAIAEYGRRACYICGRTHEPGGAQVAGDHKYEEQVTYTTKRGRKVTVWRGIMRGWLCRTHNTMLGVLEGWAGGKTFVRWTGYRSTAEEVARLILYWQTDGRMSNE